MGAVAIALPGRASWSELATAGVVLSIDVGQVSVGVTGPRGPATVARGEIVWRRDAMVTAWRAGERRTLLAVAGLRGVERAFCLSCADRVHEHAGDCRLCVAARVLALRDVGALVARPPALPERSVAAWRAKLYGAVARPDPLPPLAASPTWTCAKCGASVTGQRDRDDECGACEVKRFGVMGMSRIDAWSRG